MIECVIFDCDGILVDSEILCNLGLEIKLKEFGVKVDSKLMSDRFRGWKLADIIYVLSEEYDLKLDDNFIDSYRKVVEDLFNSQLQLIPNVAFALENISYSKCVASNAPLDKIKQAVRVTGIEHFFKDNLFSAYTVRVWKPEPDLFLYAAKMMEVSPEKCIVIEDSILGIEAAKYAGMKSFFYQPRKDILLESNETTCFENMLELPKLISKI